jgi:hypothetical protein
LSVLICNLEKQNTAHKTTTGHAGAGLALVNMEACTNYRSSNAGSNLSAPQPFSEENM